MGQPQWEYQGPSKTANARRQKAKRGRSCLALMSSIESGFNKNAAAFRENQSAVQLFALGFFCPTIKKNFFARGNQFRQLIAKFVGEILLALFAATVDFYFHF